MAELSFEESSYRFTDPIRYFKAHDPYFFEIDNIPIKQLHENILWLRDQLKIQPAGISTASRVDFEELQPYTSGSDRVVRVKPGRFTARVNDASTRQPLSFINRLFIVNDITAPNLYRVTVPELYAFDSVILLEILNKFKSSVEEDALSMNGLETRLFTWPVFSPDIPINSSGVVLDDSVDYIKYADSGTFGSEVKNLASVISQALLWVVNSKYPEYFGQSFLIETLINNSPEQSGGMSLLPRLEANFIKHWKGVTRTAVVDVPEELSIEIPPFDSSDFNWIDESGNEQQVAGVTSRIDLVFLYTKSVDASSATILKPSGKEVITTPQLGIVRGAGIKTNFNTNPTIVQNAKNGIKQPVTDEHKILASPGDSNSLGFSSIGITGSFPTPDDLLTLAPLLSERLEEDAIELVGQSILPIAYVFVREQTEETETGVSNLLNTDIVDIRPFFRTTELTYNERAGIAAAIPQLSLANPVVGRVQLDSELYQLKNEQFSTISQAVGNVVFEFSEYVPLETPYLVYNGKKPGSPFGENFTNQPAPPGQGHATTEQQIINRMGSANNLKEFILNPVFGDDPLGSIESVKVRTHIGVRDYFWNGMWLIDTYRRNAVVLRALGRPPARDFSGNIITPDSEFVKLITLSQDTVVQFSDKWDQQWVRDCEIDVPVSPFYESSDLGTPTAIKLSTKIYPSIVANEYQDYLDIGPYDPLFEAFITIVGYTKKTRYTFNVNG